MRTKKGRLSLPSTASVLCVASSIIITIFVAGINPLLASSSSQMPGMMGKNIGMENMTAMMGQNMGMQNMPGMMGQHMMFMQNMMALLAKQMTVWRIC